MAANLIFFKGLCFNIEFFVGYEIIETKWYKTKRKPMYDTTVYDSSTYKICVKLSNGTEVLSEEFSKYYTVEDEFKELLQQHMSK